MNLQESLTNIAAQIKGDGQELIAYAFEDQLGGFHADEQERKFPMGSAWAVELQTIYSLIRHLKPEKVVEIGGLAGASAIHIASALKANGTGHLYSIDNGVLGAVHGHLIPPELREYVTLVNANGEDWLAEQEDNSIGFVFEDASHESALVALLSKLALQKLEPGGYLVNHDAAHDFAIVGGGVKIPSGVGRAVRDGLAQANAYFRVYRAEPSDCGLSLTVKPNGGKGKSWSTDESKVMEQFGGMNSAKGQGVISEAPEPLSNAHIESVSTPPEPKSAPKKRAPKKAGK